MKLQEIQRCLKLDGMKDKEMLSTANKRNKSCKQKAFIQKKDVTDTPFVGNERPWIKKAFVIITVLILEKGQEMVLPTLKTT